MIILLNYFYLEYDEFIKQKKLIHQQEELSHNETYGWLREWVQQKKLELQKKDVNDFDIII